MTGECPTRGACECCGQPWPPVEYAVPALVRLAQHCETRGLGFEVYPDTVFPDYERGFRIYVRGMGFAETYLTIEASAEAALTRLAKEAPNA